MHGQFQPCGIVRLAAGGGRIDAVGTRMIRVTGQPVLQFVIAGAVLGRMHQPLKADVTQQQFAVQASNQPVGIGPASRPLQFKYLAVECFIVPG